MRSARRLRIRRRLQGLGFLVVVAALLGATIVVYNKAFPWQSADTVHLDVARIGDQLVVPADVKYDGVLVGRVSAATTTGVAADGQPQSRLTLQIDKGQIKNIPANVVARILPKTLFGEKYVELLPPVGGTPQGHLQAGATIPQDDSQTAIELQAVFSNLVPLLKTLNPAQLALTLSNIATALRGRGEELGQNLQLVNTYFTRFNTDLPTFNHDISALADLASNYADASPDLLRTLSNFSVNAKTFSEKDETFAQFLANTKGFADTAAQVIGENSQRLINLAVVSQPVTQLYADYSIVLECLPNGLAEYDRDRLESVFGAHPNGSGGPWLHITLTPVGDRGTYTAADKPSTSQYQALPPNCFGLPYGDNGLHPVDSRYPFSSPSDNCAQGGYVGATTDPCTGAPKSPAAAAAPSTAGVGSAAEQQQIQTLLGSLFGGSTVSSTDSSLDDLLLGPMLRGMAVSGS